MTLKRAACAILILAGLYLWYLGYEKRQSVAGRLDEAAAKVQYKLTGQAHLPDTAGYTFGGLILFAAGLSGVVRLRRG